MSTGWWVFIEAEFPIMTSHPHKDLICDYCKEAS